MGRTLMGGISQEGSVNLLTPEQQSFLSNVLGSNVGQAQQAYFDFLQPQSPEQFSQMFQQSFVDPSLKLLKEQIAPALQQSYLGGDEKASGSLDLALSQSAKDVTGMLGQQLMSQYNLGQQNRLSALGGLQGLIGQRAFQPLIRQDQGILGPILSALGGVAGGALGGGFGGLSSILSSLGGLR